MNKLAAIEDGAVEGALQLADAAADVQVDVDALAGGAPHHRVFPPVEQLRYPEGAKHDRAPVAGRAPATSPPPAPEPGRPGLAPCAWTGHLAQKRAQHRAVGGPRNDALQIQQLRPRPSRRWDSAAAASAPPRNARPRRPYRLGLQVRSVTADQRHDDGVVGPRHCAVRRTVPDSGRRFRNRAPGRPGAPAPCRFPRARAARGQDGRSPPGGGAQQALRITVVAVVAGEEGRVLRPGKHAA